MQFQTAQELYRKSEVKFLLNKIDALPTSAAIPCIVDWLELNRYMPPEITENYGQFNRNMIPHLIEPLMMLHPDNPTTHLTMMKSVQSGATTSLIEGAMAFYTKFKLGSCLYLTSTKSMGKVRSSSALDVLIDNSGLDKLLKPISKRDGSRKTADTTFYKEFSGGVKWLITSYNSIGDMKSNTFHLILADEWDEAGIEIADQGDIAGIIEGRTMAARNYKIVFVSTPSRMETSRIYKSFCEGDQRQMYLPCPICGREQILELYGSGKKYGLTFNMKTEKATGNKLLDEEAVRYICKYCEGEFTEAHKQNMLENGIWRPTWQTSDFRPKTKNHRSYNNQGLLSPFLPWTRICQQFVNTDYGQDLMLFKDFTINYMGRPWASQSKKSNWQDLYDRRDKYKYVDGTTGENDKIPKGVLQFTGGADVHKDRIEVIITGWGRSGESWIIEKKIFFGLTEEVDNPIWAELSLWALTKEYKVHGKAQAISRIAIDQGYNPSENKNLGRGKDFAKKPHIVQDFVAENYRFMSVRGITGQGEIITSKKIQGGKLTRRYDISVDILKEDIFARIERKEGPGAIHFPDFEKENFKQFCSEVFKQLPTKKFGWGKVYERNEVLDCYIYSLAVAHSMSLIQRTREVWDEFEQYIIDGE